MVQRVWSLRLQVLSNVLPVIPFFPFPFIAVWLESHGYMEVAVVVWVASPLVLWSSINFLALAFNESIKRRLKPLAFSMQSGPVMRTWFVGFALPHRRQMIHPHYDVGWLQLYSDEIVFVGERERTGLKKSEITGIGFSANIHTLLGLGRWMVIDGRTSTGRVRLLIEPRECRTLLGNLRLGKRMVAEIRRWWLGKR